MVIQKKKKTKKNTYLVIVSLILYREWFTKHYDPIFVLDIAVIKNLIVKFINILYDHICKF